MIPVRTIKVDQPPAFPRIHHSATLYQWWKLPSGQIVELRKIEGQRAPECTVRNVNEDGELGPGEYVLTLRFLVTHGRKVKG